jgi:dynein heavy chain 1
MNKMYFVCLKVLKCERPDVEEKRLDLLKIQGEYQQRLRHLEKGLLQALNDVKGRILDDNSIIAKLENLKQEAGDINRKVQETDVIIKEVDMAINLYLSLSQSCSTIYFTMDVFNQIHTLYQYSLQYFLEIFNTVLTNNSHLKDIKDSAQRLSIISTDLFYLTYYRLARGMLHNDRIVLALLLAKIYLKGFRNEQSIDTDFLYIISSPTLLVPKLTAISGLTIEQTNAVLSLSKYPSFDNLKVRISNNCEFSKWLECERPETQVPELWADTSTTLSDIGKAMKGLMVIKAFRPDHFVSMAEKFVSTVFGDEFLKQPEKLLDLADIVETEIKSMTPILMCSVPGFDASGRVEDLAAETNKQLVSIAIGSAEGFTLAEKTINTASKTGKWVLLKNVHLATHWLVQLEKKLHNLQVHPSFRIFLSMEINPKLPSNILRLGRVFVFEPPPGIKANLLRTMSVIPAQRMNKAPNERSRLYFLLAWLHAITQERLRYVPLGWSKFYEFNESDLRCALDTIDVWIDSVAMGRTNLPPSKVPFDAIFTLMSDCVYGGKIDNAFDRRLLDTFIKQLFTAKSFDSDYKLVDDESVNIAIPDAIRREQFLQWIENLKVQQTPSWLGLPNSAEKVLLNNYGVEVANKLMKLSVLDEEEDELAYNPDGGADETRVADLIAGQPSWMRQLQQAVVEWQRFLPNTLLPIRRTVENIKDPLFRFFEREINTGIKLLKKVVHDLEDVNLICQGDKKQTNYHRQLLKDLAKGSFFLNIRLNGCAEKIK